MKRSIVQTRNSCFEGTKAGLSTGRDVRQEIEAKKKKEEEMFNQVKISCEAAFRGCVRCSVC